MMETDMQMEQIMKMRRNIVGQTIIEYVVSEDGMPVIVLSTGDMLIIQSDAEGNGPGHIVYIRERRR